MPDEKPGPRLLTVKDARRITPRMIRVTFAGEALAGLPAGREGANCKLSLPEPGERRAAFAVRLLTGPAPVRRTFTVRHYRPEALELDIDFVDHGDGGPASAWARAARPGAFLGFAGPGPVKVASYHSDFYVLAADLSALPMAAATLEAMPRDARGIALFEIPSAEDAQAIEAPPGIEIRWRLHPDPTVSSRAALDLMRELDRPAGRLQVCAAGEHGAIAALRRHLLVDKGMDKSDCYISGYWKIGLVEDEHQAFKRSETAA